MNLLVPISVGDFIDKISILEIKKDFGLPVDDELNEYLIVSTTFEKIYFSYYKEIIKAINLQLWDIEKLKRTKSARYSDDYSELSTLTCQLNDLRHETKKRIDLFYNSKLRELKKHD
jgi:hypothetical protein